MGSTGELHDRLHGGLWHTTRPDRLLSIMESRAMLVEPNIDDRERSNTANGPKNSPISRTIGGISLFDFQGFYQESYQRQFPISSCISLSHMSGAGKALCGFKSSAKL